MISVRLDAKTVQRVRRAARFAGVSQSEFARQSLVAAADAILARSGGPVVETRTDQPTLVAGMAPPPVSTDVPPRARTTVEIIGGTLRAPDASGAQVEYAPA